MKRTHRPDQGRRSLLLVWSFAFLGALQLPLAAEGGDVAQATTGEAPLALVRVGLEVGVQNATGDVAPIDLQPTARLQAIEPLTDGWIAVGSRWRGQEIDLFLVEAKNGRNLELPVPDGFSGPPRRSPRLVVADGELKGLVWLEGLTEPELTVWAAPWKGGAWGPPELVSPPGPGAQLAPSVVVLDDGTWLLVWAAVDGEDDEILWSRRGPDGWLEPARLHPDNTVPDITPVVTAVRGGALAAWSFLDRNHFRMLSARFDGKSWTVSPPFGLDGSHRPLFLHRDGKPALLYRTSWPAGWAVVDHDGDGRVLRRSFLALENGQQPILDVGGSDGDEVRFLRPAAAGESTAVELRAVWESER